MIGLKGIYIYIFILLFLQKLVGFERKLITAGHIFVFFSRGLNQMEVARCEFFATKITRLLEHSQLFVLRAGQDPFGAPLLVIPPNANCAYEPQNCTFEQCLIGQPSLHIGQPPVRPTSSCAFQPSWKIDFLFQAPSVRCHVSGNCLNKTLLWSSFQTCRVPEVQLSLRVQTTIKTPVGLVFHHHCLPFRNNSSKLGALGPFFLEP